jgi:arylsulfatase A-like enzyme
MSADMRRLVQILRSASILLPISMFPFGLGCSGSGELPPPERIVLIVADTLRRDHVSAYAEAVDSAPVHTPNIDALARNGQTFRNAFSSFHQTTMSMSSLFTGHTPSLERGEGQARLAWTGESWCGLERFGRGEATASCIPKSVSTLAEALRDADYWTAGVASNKLMHRPGGYERGFAHWVELQGRPVPAAHVNQAVAEALRRRPQDRFFLYVHYMDVHDYVFRGDEYASGVATVDRAVGRLVAMLEQLDLMEGTVILFTSDHGEHLDGERHFLRALRGHSGSPTFDSLIRVPLIVAPARFEGTSAIVRGDDVHRMILQLAGRAPEPKPQLRPGELFLSERDYQTYRFGRWKSYRHRESGRHHVVDLGSDAQERRDVAAEHPGVRKAHGERLDELALQLGSPDTPRRTLSPHDEARLRELGYLETE